MTLVNNLITAIFKPHRRIDTIVAQVTIEEEHMDRMRITSHPVERGAPVSDHIYKEPAELTLRCAWSNSGLDALGQEILALARLLSNKEFGSFNYVQKVYQKLLELEESGEPFDIVTGKRNYKNMVIQALSTTTTQETEYSFFATIRCQQIIFADTKVITFPPKEDQKFPELTMPPESTGAKQVVPGTLYVGPEFP